jgi:hypothetical protein
MRTVGNSLPEMRALEAWTEEGRATMSEEKMPNDLEPVVMCGGKRAHMAILAG